MVYYLYILHSESIDKYYTGVSHDPATRVQYHNSFNKGWTRRGRPWTIVFSKEFLSKSEALKAERYVKQQKSQIFVKELVTGIRELDL